jgi:beta-glucanase (GH16 family)
MRCRLLWGALCVMLVAAPAAGQSYRLVWQDEFIGTQLDPTKWSPQVGTGCPTLCGWGNNELQYYRAENATVGGGFLTITAKRENFGGQQYTSARLRTLGLGDWTYGRIEMRARMPIGQGLWPALWMLPSDNAYGVWAASGEIDILEYLGHQPNRVFGTLHYGGSFPANTFNSLAYVLPSGEFHSTFHEFAIEWDRCAMRWYVDGQLYATQTDWWSSGGPFPAPFDQRFHLLLNLAVGGNLPGPPNGSTVFPQQLVVDWVRVYQRADDQACSVEFDGMDHGNPFANGWFSFNGSVGGGGLDGNTTDLPPGVGCRASLQTGWGSGGTPGFQGGFGRRKPLNLTGYTHFAMWIKPDPGQSYRLEINLQDDDNGDDQIPGVPDGADDEFEYDLVVGPAGPGAVAGGGWQRVVIPISAFTDDNSFHFGGNGVFDPRPTSAGGNGRLVNVVVAVVSLSGSDATFRTDQWEFLRQEGGIAGRLWSDDDGDTVVDAGEPPLAGIPLALEDAVTGATLAASATLADGTYAFPALAGGEYRVRVTTAALPTGFIPTSDPDGVASVGLATTALACDEDRAGFDFGFATDFLDVETPVTTGLSLGRVAPNPAAGQARLAFELPRAMPVLLRVHDVAGRPVRTLARGDLAAGRHAAQWDGRDADGRLVAEGVYVVVLETPEGRRSRRMTLLR